MAMFQPILQSQPQGEGYVEPVKEDTSTFTAMTELASKGLEAYGEHKDIQSLGEFRGSRSDIALVEPTDVEDAEARKALSLTELQAAKQQGMRPSELNTRFNAKLKEAITAAPHLAGKYRELAREWFGSSGGGSGGGGIFSQEEDPATKMASSAYEALVKSGKVIFDPTVVNNPELLAQVVTEQGVAHKNMEIDAKNANVVGQTYISKHATTALSGLTTVFYNITNSNSPPDIKQRQMGEQLALTKDKLLADAGYYGNRLSSEDKTILLKRVNGLFAGYSEANIKGYANGSLRAETLANENKTLIEVSKADWYRKNPDMLAMAMVKDTGGSALANSLFGTGNLAAIKSTASASASVFNKRAGSVFYANQGQQPLTQEQKESGADYLLTQVLDPKTNNKEKLVAVKDLATKLDLNTFKKEDMDATMLENSLSVLEDVSQYVVNNLPRSMVEANNGEIPEGQWEVQKDATNNPIVVFTGKDSNKPQYRNIGNTLTGLYRLTTLTSGEPTQFLDVINQRTQTGDYKPAEGLLDKIEIRGKQYVASELARAAENREDLLNFFGFGEEK
jgi:hypothetical protein